MYMNSVHVHCTCIFIECDCVLSQVIKNLKVDETHLFVQDISSIFDVIEIGLRANVQNVSIKGGVMSRRKGQREVHM